MEPWLVQLAINAPVAAAVIVVVRMLVTAGIKHIEVRDENLKTISEGCHNVQREANQVLGEIRPVLSEVRTLLIKMNGGRR